MRTSAKGEGVCQMRTGGRGYGIGSFFADVLYGRPLEEDETLQQTALRRKLRFFGHVMRSDGLEKRIMLAFGDGRRRRGRPRRTWMDEIHEVTGMKLVELRDVTAERKH